MRVLVCGASGCVGSAVVHALGARGHAVIAGARACADTPRTLHMDFMQPRAPATWAALLRERRVDAIVNCVGILIPASGQSFERVHAQGPIELFRGASLAGVQRVVQVSALGVHDSADACGVPYLLSKLKADDALAALPLQSAVLRPSLVYGPGSASAALFTTLASLPVIAVPGRGQQQVQPIHVYEVAEAIVRLLERSDPLGQGETLELAGPHCISYRDMLAAYRHALQLGPPWWVPVPMALMTWGARLAEWLPQRVLSRDTLRLLERGNTAQANAAPALLGRAPTAMAPALATTAPTPLLDLGVYLGPAINLALRAALAALWLITALVTLLLPQESGVLQLLERCGIPGAAGMVVMLATCALNTALGLAVLWRPGPVVYALQMVAVLAYTFTAAWHVPQLAIDHCGPLLKNLPVLALLAVLWTAHGRRGGLTPTRLGARGTAAFGATLPPRYTRSSTTAMP